jgi:hypothetical protein
MPVGISNRSVFHDSLLKSDRVFSLLRKSMMRVPDRKNCDTLIINFDNGREAIISPSPNMYIQDMIFLLSIDLQIT